MADEKIPSLASLRRPKRQRFHTPSLFDSLSSPEPAAVEIVLPPSPKPAEPELPLEAAPKVWTVVELLQRLRGMVERSYGQVTVEGEISNWRPAASGHCYFTLKDGQAQLAIVMFRQQAQRMRFRAKDGDAVRITGALTVYESRGQMQLVAERMEQVGLGALLAATRELKEQLRLEGLFDNKRSLPAFPRCIGVVTSLHGAALRDIIKVCKRRHASVKLLIYPAAVQGPQCAKEVLRAVEWFSAHPDRVDVVIVARGGGSWEDLHGFDDEGVVRSIAACRVPVIVGVGHATDTTIADAAADVCAPTPSAAAELVTAAQHRLEEQVLSLSSRLQRAARYELLRTRQRLSLLGADAQLRRVQESVRRRQQRVDELDSAVESSMESALQLRRMAVDALERRLRQRSPEAAIIRRRQRFAGLDTRLLAAQSELLRERQWRLREMTTQLGALSPLGILERGYALIQDGEGHVIRDASQVYSGQGIVARVGRGRFRARVEYSE